MPALRWSSLIALLSLIVPSVAAAQTGPTPRPGERVQVRIVGPEDAPVGLRCTGRVTALALDTVVLGQPRNCPLGSYAADLRVARGSHGSRLAHIGIGFLGGALAGGILARIAAGDGCRIAGCDDGDYVVAIQTAVGTAAGAVIGAVVGAALPAGPRWLAATATRSIRVAGLEVRPELRMSFDDRRGR